MNIQLFPCSIGGRLCAPPSKSMAHRSVLAAALAEGTSPVQNLAQSRDIQATLAGVARLGAKIAPADGGVAITGAGAPARWRFDLAQPVDCGESGSTLRFFIPVFSLTGETVRFCGGGRLFSRPQQVYADLFAARGLAFAQTEQGVTLKGALPPGDYTLPGDVSSQFITGLLYALPLLPGDSTITLTGKVESRPYIDLTLSALADFGVTARWLDERRLAVPGGQHCRPCSYRVEGDYSQAAFPAVLGAVCGGVAVTGLRPDSLQGDAAILDILARCGANFTRTGDEVHFQAAPLRATAIDLAACPDLGPILMVLGLFCEGDTVITNAGRLRIKESDRIAAMQEELAKFGGQVLAKGETVTVKGLGGALRAPTQPLNSHNDHRVAMALSVAAWAAGLPALLEDAGAVAKSWPTFFEDMARGLGTRWQAREE